jgi:5,10-methylenetetrahydromethanopterin reductase
MPDRLALYLRDFLPLRDSLKLVQYAETRGFEAVWQADLPLGRDAFTALAAYAATTLRIRLGSASVNHWARHAATLAATLLTLDDLAPDRIIGGLGAWDEREARLLGQLPRKPLLAMRETVNSVRDLLAGRAVTVGGEFVQIAGARLDLGARREARVVPLYLSSEGDKMAALAGEIADGVLLQGLISPAYTALLIEELGRGLRKAGRSIDAIDRPQIIYCAVDRDRKTALDIARRTVTRHLAHQPGVARACGVPPGLLDEIAQVLPMHYTPEQLADAARLVPDDVVQLLTAAGDADEVRVRVRDYFDAGATCAALLPLGADARMMIDIFSNPYVR